MQLSPMLPERDLPTTVVPSDLSYDVIHSPQATTRVEPKRKLTIFDLPLEIRELIWRELLVADALSVQRDSDTGVDVGMRLTCQQLKTEGWDVYTSWNCWINVIVTGPDQMQFPIGDLGMCEPYEEPLSATFHIIMGVMRPHNPSVRTVIITAAHLSKLTNLIWRCRVSTGVMIALHVIFAFATPLSYRFHAHIMDSLSEIRGLHAIGFAYAIGGMLTVPQPPPFDFNKFAVMMLSPMQLSTIQHRLEEDRLSAVKWMLRAYGSHRPDPHNGLIHIGADRLLQVMRIYDLLDGVVDPMLLHPHYQRWRHPDCKFWVELQARKVGYACLIAIACNRMQDYKTAIRYILSFKKPGGIYIANDGRVFNPLTKNQAVCLYEQLGVAYFALEQYDFALYAWFEAWMMEPKRPSLTDQLRDLEVKVKSNAFPPLALDHPIVRCSKMLKPLGMIMKSSGYEAGTRAQEDANAVRLFVRKSIGDLYGWKDMQAVVKAVHNVNLTNQSPSLGSVSSDLEEYSGSKILLIMM